MPENRERFAVAWLRVSVHKDEAIARAWAFLIERLPANLNIEYLHRWPPGLKPKTSYEGSLPSQHAVSNLQSRLLYPTKDVIHVGPKSTVRSI